MKARERETMKTGREIGKNNENGGKREMYRRKGHMHGVCGHVYTHKNRCCPRDVQNHFSESSQKSNQKPKACLLKFKSAHKSFTFRCPHNLLCIYGLRVCLYRHIRLYTASILVFSLRTYSASWELRTPYFD